jgi:mono/diheme cytochrome c family protein
MNKVLFVIALGLAQNALAETPAQFIASYSAEAGAGFKADIARGKAFAGKNWGVSEKLASCTACHTDNPANPGRHAVTGKAIQPLSPAVNPERFSDPAKVEKWFKRNCKEVVGRACTPAEKADFIQFVVGGK